MTAAAVTGATGFVGSHLAERLLADGHVVRCLVRPGQRLPWPGVQLTEGRLDQPDALRRLVEGAEVVYHVAGATAAPDEAGFLRVNADGTRRVAEACREAGTSRLVHVSSLAVTGPTRRGTAVSATTTPAPVTPYGRSKLAGEIVVRESGVRFTIVRPPVVYGPRDPQLLRLFRLARRGVVPLLGDGRQELSLVHAADLAGALVAAARSASAAGRVYHAAHPEAIDQLGLARMVGRAVGRASVRALPLPPALVRAALHVTGAAARLARRTTLLGPDKAPEFLAPAWVCSSEELARDAGWRAAIAHEDGMRATATWYREAGWL